MNIAIGIICFIAGLLFREWSPRVQKGMNWIRNRPHKKKIIEHTKKQFEAMKKAGAIPADESYESIEVCLFCPFPHADIIMKSKKPRADLSMVHPDGPPPKRGA